MATVLDEPLTLLMPPYSTKNRPGPQFNEIYQSKNLTGDNLTRHGSHFRFEVTRWPSTEAQTLQGIGRNGQEKASRNSPRDKTFAL